ncbi:MAG: hypothetical protein OEY44_01500 [Candidatus Peregrinibacteria bacterium]|nr:hypothetical protein [Candidatus Peregrinibacteria bacterium]
MLKPLRKIARLPFLPVTWPLKKVAQLGYKGLEMGIDGTTWSGHTGAEAAKGAGQILLAPPAMLVKSRLVTMKRFMWNVPLKLMSAAIRTPIALAKSPFRVVGGVREAIQSIPNNVGSFLNAARNFNLRDMMGATRDTIRDIIVPPIKNPLAPVLKPAGEVLDTAAGAELQTLTTIRQAITEVIPEGFERIKNSPNVGDAVVAENRIGRDLRKKAKEEEKKHKEDHYTTRIAEARGRPVPLTVSNRGGGARAAA